MIITDVQYYYFHYSLICSYTFVPDMESSDSKSKMLRTKKITLKWTAESKNGLFKKIKKVGIYNNYFNRNYDKRICLELLKTVLKKVNSEILHIIQHFFGNLIRNTNNRKIRIKENMLIADFLNLISYISSTQFILSV